MRYTIKNEADEAIGTYSVNRQTPISESVHIAIDSDLLNADLEIQDADEGNHYATLTVKGRQDTEITIQIGSWHDGLESVGEVYALGRQEFESIWRFVNSFCPQVEAKDVVIKVYCQPDWTPIQGNLIVSGNAGFDRQMEKKVMQDLENGNEWAWCVAIVEGSYKGHNASDSLHGCSYKGMGDFVRNSGYYEDMVANVVKQINKELREEYEAHSK